MLPLGFAMLIVGGVLSLAGVSGSSIASVVKGKPDKAKAGGLGAGGTTSSSPAPPTGGAGATESQAAVRRQIVAFFQSKGLTKAQAAGIAGNAQQESSLDPNAPGGGLFQDIGSRSPSGQGSLQAQLQAAWGELLGAESGVLSELRRAHTPAEAARIFSEGFERPGEPDLANRESYANGAYAE